MTSLETTKSTVDRFSLLSAPIQRSIVLFLGKHIFVVSSVSKGMQTLTSSETFYNTLNAQFGISRSPSEAGFNQRVGRLLALAESFSPQRLILLMRINQAFTRSNNSIIDPKLFSQLRPMLGSDSTASFVTLMQTLPNIDTSIITRSAVKKNDINFINFLFQCGVPFTPMDWIEAFKLLPDDQVLLAILKSGLIRVNGRVEDINKKIEVKKHLLLAILYTPGVIDAENLQKVKKLINLFQVPIYKEESYALYDRFFNYYGTEGRDELLRLMSNPTPAVTLDAPSTWGSSPAFTDQPFTFGDSAALPAPSTTETPLESTTTPFTFGDLSNFTFGS